ncbi:hypothetical protein ACFL6C_09565 [Myxococcota bacterium]
MFETDVVAPTVMLLVDQSASMVKPYPGGTRWSVLRDTLVDPGEGVVSRLDSVVRFGVTFFTSQDEASECPILTTELPALANFAGIAFLYSQVGPKQDTPTGESIDTMVGILATLSLPGPQYIVLATDGEPDTCADPDSDLGQTVALEATQRAYDSQIPVFVLSVGQDDLSLSHLQELANAGVGLPIDGSAGNAPYFQPNDADELARAFDDIFKRVLTCVFTLEGEIRPALVGEGIVHLDGDRLSFNDPDGWRYILPDRIELLGGSCEAAMHPGDHVVTVELPCWDDPG